MANWIERLDELASNSNNYVVVREPHDYPDGTDAFYHVAYEWVDRTGRVMPIFVGDHLTKDLAELIVLLLNNAQTLARITLNHHWKMKYDFEGAVDGIEASWKDISEYKSAHPSNRRPANPPQDEQMAGGSSSPESAKEE